MNDNERLASHKADGMAAMLTIFLPIICNHSKRIGKNQFSERKADTMLASIRFFLDRVPLNPHSP